jgi:glycosyltransferase involved in cell wall biosynthesis
MKVLIIAFAFPPANVIGAIRVGKLARYLDRLGHDVRVLTTDVIDDRSLPLEIPRDRVIYTDYRERGNLLDFFAGPFRARSLVNPAPAVERGQKPSDTAKSPFRSFVRRQYYSMLHIPDMRASWIKTAVPAGRRLMEQWRPEIIFASAPPYTGLIVASRLARAFHVPWVADFRDLWVDNPYYCEPSWRRPIDAAIERSTLRSAAGLVTVSPIWADQLRRRHGKSAEVVYNGYAEEDFPPLPPRAERGHVLTIRYMGSIYPGFRDPSPVFAGIALLPYALRDRVAVEFYSDAEDAVIAAAAAHGVTDIVAVKPRVPYRRALELQMQADVLLLLQSTDRQDEGNLPAKLFEYLYARRPILFVGYQRGIAARLIGERSAGLVTSNPATIRDQLQAWIAEKEAGGLRMLERRVCAGLSRDEQFQHLERLFAKILCEAGRPRASA